VLHVVKNSLPQVQAGYTLRTQAVLRTQAAAGLDVCAVTRLGFPVAQGQLANRVDVVDGIPYHRLLAMRGTDVAEYGRRLAAFARSQRVDLIHAATDHVNGQAAIIAADALGLPFVYEVRGFLEDSWACRHGGDARAGATDRYQWAHDRETEAMLAADAVVTLSRSMADEIAARGVEPDRIWQVPNGVDDSYLAAPREPSSVRSALGLPDDRTWVGAVTTLHTYEGLDTLIEAVALVRAAGTDVGAVIVGDGPALRELRALDPGDGTIRWIGRVPGRSAIDWYDALDAVIVPREDHRVTRLVTPLKPVEALARGRLVIASDLPALREATGGHARFVTPSDAPALAEELVRIDDHRGLGAAGREWVLAERQWRHVCTAYLDAYAAASSR
jgi:glycosyltransferase involved in cell wall biosynthesis